MSSRSAVAFPPKQAAAGRPALAVARRPLDNIFRPRSVAVVGASTDPQCVGRQILDNLLEFGYPGRTYVVNPKAQEIGGLPCHGSLREIAGPVDLAVLVVPRRAVFSVIEDAAASGVGGLVVVTAGFRELGGEGARLEKELQQRAAQARLPMVGPNCMGVFNTDPAVRLNLTFSPVAPRAGHIAFLSQSGALGATVLSLAELEGVGFSLFASLGNEAGLTHRDALAYAATDPLTRVIVLYLETFDAPAEFLQLAREVSRQKPIVCLKGGRTESGARAASSHTGALATASRAFEAILRQSGVVLADSTAEMLDVAQGLARAPLPQARRVRVLTNAGGPGVLATDKLSARGLALPPLEAARQALLREFVTPQALVGNPVDLTVEGTPLVYGRAARALLEDETTDALLAIFVCPPRISGPAVLHELQEAAADASKPVVAAFPAQPELRRHAPESAMALVEYPESAAGVLAALADYAGWRQRTEGWVRRFRANRARVEKLLARAQREKRGALDAEESLEALRAYGIPTPRYALVRPNRARRRAELAAAARRIGFPLALKVVSPAIVHKTEVGGVVLNIKSLAELREAYGELLARVRGAGPLRGVLLQQMAPAGRELILGFRRDAQGTPLLLAGLGGVLAEALDAVAVRALPATDQDIRELLDEMPGGRVLGAFRGMRPVQRARLEEALARLAQLGSEHPAIEEIDLNPFVASADPGRCQALDARILLAAA
ncbi:MAG: acetate--CoA ligase family protein [Candidatus Acidiferrales bacterium]